MAAVEFTKDSATSGTLGKACTDTLALSTVTAALGGVNLSKTTGPAKIDFAASNVNLNF
ncbi:hypothetical protein AVCANL283_09005 [Campylobacter canadensis]|uniref:Toxin n=1 Tax=Campylobacter canadensis TaxID=449520 RepID=A0ABS7WWC8_9BACT|nr:hypothetical protein [Campylobacter canadensis]MBZ7988224.1 hypothetical protein [Campylobacter canadensis]